MNEAEERVKGMLQALAKRIATQIPPSHGFALLVFTRGENPTMQYVANAQRLDIIQAMREFIAVQSEERAFQRDIEHQGEEEFEQWWQQQKERLYPSGSPSVKSMCYDAFVAGRSTA